MGSETFNNNKKRAPCRAPLDPHPDTGTIPQGRLASIVCPLQIMKVLRFPEEFEWGTATAAFQIEGSKGGKDLHPPFCVIFNSKT